MKKPLSISEKTQAEIANILAAGILRLHKRLTKTGDNIAGYQADTASHKAVDIMENLRMYDRNEKGTAKNA